MTKKQSKENTTYYITSGSGHPIDDVVIINGVEYRKTVKPDIKPKVKTLYEMLDDESTYGCIGLDAAFKVVKDWLYDNSTIVTEDYSTVTLKLKKGAFGDAN